MVTVILPQEFGGCDMIQLSKLQPDGRFAVDVNDTTGQSNRKRKLDLLFSVWDMAHL